MTWRRTIRTLVAAAALVGGCSGGMQADKKMTEQKSLYDRLGGKPAITVVVDDFIGNVAGDTRINKRFANANIPRLKTMLVDQICEASGGPCKYTGASMKDAHKGMKITEAQFAAVVEDLKMALEEKGVGEGERNDLFALLAPMKDDIVEVKDKAK